MTEELDDYILSHIDPEPPHLTALNRHTQLHHLYGHMCSGHLQGRVLAMLTRMIRPHRVLELGTFTGYSTICMAEALEPGAEIHTIEINDESADELSATFAPYPEITLHIGDALTLIDGLPPGWDMAFIDANKRLYCEYFRRLLPRMNPGAFILADNTLWGDKLLTPDARHDAQTRGILEFNDMVASDHRVERVILPLRDGLTILRVKPQETSLYL